MFKKTVAELVQDFLNKVRSRHDKIEANVSKLKIQEQQISKQIAANTSAMVECQLEDDDTEAAKLQKENVQLNIKLAEIRDHIQAFENQKGAGADYSKDLQAIQAASIKEVESNQKKSSQIDQQVADLKREKERIEAKIKQLEADRVAISNSEDSIKRIVEYIDPRYKELNFSRQSSFLRHWSRGGMEAIDHLFAEHEQLSRSGGGRITQGVEVSPPPKQEIKAAVIQTVNRRGSEATTADLRSDFEATVANWKVRHPNATIVDTENQGSGNILIRYTMDA